MLTKASLAGADLWSKPLCIKEEVAYHCQIAPRALYSITPLWKRCRGEWGLYIYLHFCILSSLFVYFLACHPSSTPLYISSGAMYVWDSLLPDAVYIALRVLFVLLSTLLLSCGNFCLDAVYMRYQLGLLLECIRVGQPFNLNCFCSIHWNALCTWRTLWAPEERGQTLAEERGQTLWS